MRIPLSWKRNRTNFNVGSLGTCTRHSAFSFSLSLFLTKSSNALYLQRKLLQYNCVFKRIVHVCKHVDAKTTFMFCTLHGSMFSCTERSWACSTPARAFFLFGRQSIQLSDENARRSKNEGKLPGEKRNLFSPFGCRNAPVLDQSLRSTEIEHEKARERFLFRWKSHDWWRTMTSYPCAWQTFLLALFETPFRGGYL